MRILVAPDDFAGTLSAVEAAEAIARGWRQRAPADEVTCVPMADGGPGLLDVLPAVLGGELLAVTVTGPLGEPTPAAVLVVPDAAGPTAYVESAQACGRHLLDPGPGDAERATTLGVGELVVAAVDAGAARVVVGLGGSATTDGGAGMLAALGARSDPAGALSAGPSRLGELADVDAAPARQRIAGVELVVATDVDNPLLGLRGVASVFGAQKGLPDDRKPAVDAALTRLADLTDRKLADAKGAGAAGGLGFALLLLGGRREAGVGLVATAVGLSEHARRADLVVTGEGSFDAQSRGGKVVAGVAQVAGEALRPCVVIAGRVRLGAREMRTMGVQSAYSVVEAVGEEAALARPGDSLATVATRVARTWSH